MGLLTYISSRPAWQHLILLLFFVGISYSNTLYSPFYLDDTHSFIDEPNVYTNTLSADSIKKLASTSFGLTRFIPIATFAIDHNFVYWLNTGIAQYHVTNIIIHLLATTALYLFLITLFANSSSGILHILSPKGFALCVCALWALHPVQTNAVTYLVQRMTSLAALFYIATLLLYIRGRKTPLFATKLLWFTGATLLACCALMSKEIAATLPLAILLIEAFFLAPHFVQQATRNISWRYCLTGIILTMALLPPILTVLDSFLSSYAYRHYTLTERLLTEARVVVFYVSLLILPLPGRMNIDHDFSISTSLFSPLTTVVAIIIIGVSIWTAFRLRSRSPVIAFGILWFFVNLVIESTILPLELVFEHRLYLPSVGFFLLVIGACDILMHRLQLTSPQLEIRHIGIIALLITASLYSVLTSLRNNDWKDYLTITRDAFQKSPNKPRSLTNYGYALSLEKSYDESTRILEKALSLGRRRYETHLVAATNIMANHMEKKEFELAVKIGERFLKETQTEINQTSIQKFLQDLALAYAETRQYRKAYDAAVSAYLLEEKNNNIVQILFYILDKAYADARTNKELGLDIPFATKEEAMVLKVAQTNLDLKYYEKARNYLKLVEQTNPSNEQYQRLQLRHDEELKKNELPQNQDNLKQHKTYQKDRTYRVSMDAANFIMTYYSPLVRLAGPLLDIAGIQAPNDPFVALYRVQYFNQLGNSTRLIAEIDNAIKQHPDFIPLLEIAGDLKPGTIMNKTQQVELYQKILSHFPAHPRWHYYEVLIRQNSIKTSEPPAPVQKETSS